MADRLELYDTLKDKLGTEAARMLADAIPSAQDLATKADIARLEGRFASLDVRFATLDGRFETLEASLDAKLSKMQAEIRGWMLSFFVPLWIGVYGTLAAIVVGFTLGR